MPPTPTKAHKMLVEGRANGRPLSPAQKRLFGAIVGAARAGRKFRPRKK